MNMQSVGPLKQTIKPHELGLTAKRPNQEAFLVKDNPSWKKGKIDRPPIDAKDRETHLSKEVHHEGKPQKDQTLQVIKKMMKEASRVAKPDQGDEKEQIEARHQVITETVSQADSAADKDPVANDFVASEATTNAIETILQDPPLENLIESPNLASELDLEELVTSEELEDVVAMLGAFLVQIDQVDQTQPTLEASQAQPEVLIEGDVPFEWVAFEQALERTSQKLELKNIMVQFEEVMQAVQAKEETGGGHQPLDPKLLQALVENLQNLIGGDKGQTLATTNTDQTMPQVVHQLAELLNALQGKIEKVTGQAQTATHFDQEDLPRPQESVLKNDLKTTPEAMTGSLLGSKTQGEGETKSEPTSTKASQPISERLEIPPQTPGLTDKAQPLLEKEIVQEAKMRPFSDVMREQVMSQMKTAIGKVHIQSDGQTEMIIRLKPESLGKVELKVEVHKDHVVAKFNVASQMVKETIESSLNDLRSALKDRGFSDMTFNVNVGGGKKEFSHQESGRRRNHQSGGFIPGQVVSEIKQYQKSLESLMSDATFEHFA